MDKEKLQLAISVHSELSQLIAPATPASIKASSFKGNKPIIFILIIALASFMGVVLHIAMKDVGEDAKYISDSFGILSAAGLGASFYALNTAAGYIRKGTYDPKYNQIYFIRLALGICAGGILGLFGDPILKLFAGGANAQEVNVVAGATGGFVIGKTLLALVGGYSSEAVGLMLKRVSDTLVTLVRGNDEDGAKAVAEKQSLQTKAKLSSDLQEVLTLPDADKDKKLKEIMSKLTK